MEQKTKKTNAAYVLALGNLTMTKSKQKNHKLLVFLKYIMLFLKWHKQLFVACYINLLLYMKLIIITFWLPCPFGK